MTIPIQGRLSYNQQLIIGVTTVVLVLAFISYGLRLYARRVAGAKVWWDDHMIAAGMLFATIPCISNYVGLHYGFGLHADTLPETDPEAYLVCLFTLLLAWMISSTLIKYGILLFYWRLFPNKHFRWSIYAVAIFVTGCFIAGFVGFTLQCTPVRGFWRPELQHTCIDQNQFYIATATLGLIGDVILLIQPIPIVWRLNTTRQRRIGLCIVFLLGGIVCIISICRLFAINAINPKDITYSNVGPGLWTTAEVQIGVVSANLPSLRPLFGKFAAKASKMTNIGYKESDNHTIPPNRLTPRTKGFHRMADYQVRQPNGLTSAARPGRPDSDNLDFELGLPLHGIAVKTDVEQIVENLAAEPHAVTVGDTKAVPWEEEDYHS